MPLFAAFFRQLLPMFAIAATAYCFRLRHPHCHASFATPLMPAAYTMLPLPPLPLRRHYDDA